MREDYSIFNKLFWKYLFTGKLFHKWFFRSDIKYVLYDSISDIKSFINKKVE